MNLNLFVENESFHYSRNRVEPLFERLIELKDLVDNATGVSDNVYINDEVYDIEFNHHEKLEDWLFSSSGVKRDEKIMLMELLGRAESIDSSHYQDAERVINTGDIERHTAFLCLYSSSNELLYVKNTKDWNRVSRLLVSKVKCVDDFNLLKGRCFPNLYFHDRVESSLGTLSSPLKDYKEEVFKHLGVINDLFPVIYREYQKEGLPAVLRIFESKSGILCTPEGNNKKVKDVMTFRFVSNDGNAVNIKCEAHTKLSVSGKNSQANYSPDRIHFHPGKDDIEGGKVLIAYIGKHL